MPITQLICSLKKFNVVEMKTDIKLNLLDDSIIVNTIEKVIKFEIKKPSFCLPVRTTRLKIQWNEKYYLKRVFLGIFYLKLS